MCPCAKRSELRKLNNSSNQNQNFYENPFVLLLVKKNQVVNDRPVLGVGIREILFFSFIFNNKYTKAYYEEAMYNYNLILLVDFQLNFS